MASAAATRVQSGVFQREECSSYRDVVKEMVESLLNTCLYTARTKSQTPNEVGMNFRRGVEAWNAAPTDVIDKFTSEQIRTFPLLPALYKHAFISIAAAIYDSDRPVHINDAAVDVRQGMRTLLRTLAMSPEVLNGEFTRRMTSIEKSQFCESLIRRAILRDHASGGVIYAGEAPVAPPPRMELPMELPVELPMAASPFLHQQMPSIPPRENASVDSGWGSDAKKASPPTVEEAKLPMLSNDNSTATMTLNVLSKVSPQSPHGKAFPAPPVDDKNSEAERMDKDLLVPMSDISHTDEVRRKIGGAEATGMVSLVSVDDSASQVAAAMRRVEQK